MADPDWLGRQPEEAHWSADSSQVYYQRKREGSELRDWYARPLEAKGNGDAVALAQLHQLGSDAAVYNRDRSMQAWVFEGDVFVRTMQTGNVSQLTRDNTVQSAPQFLLDGKVAYREGWTYYAHDIATGQRLELASLKTEQQPEAPAKPAG